MKCEFCNRGVSAACKTCDAPLCAYHRKRGDNGECADCWRERLECDDCGAYGAPRCADCNSMPQVQSEIHAFPPCAGCCKYGGQASGCASCDEWLCRACVSKCAGCKASFCYICVSYHCQPCENARLARVMALYGDDELFLYSKLPAKLCWPCYRDHQYVCDFPPSYRGDYSDDDDRPTRGYEI
jgi:hypothetical protein